MEIEDDYRFKRGMWMLENQIENAEDLLAFWRVVGYIGKTLTE